MAAAAQRPKLVVIVGPTASGKSELAMCIACEFDGEIVCADSRTVYKGMDIGTAKPSKQEQAKIKHWGLDLIELGERFTAAHFKKYTDQKLEEIHGRGKLPILVGGTGLYIDSVIFDFGFRADFDQNKRKKLEALNIETLQDFIREMSLPMPFNLKNKRHLIRTIEAKGQKGTKNQKLQKDTMLIGLLPSDNKIKSSIEARIEKNFTGLIKETKMLVNKYGPEKLLATAGIAYKVSFQFIAGEIEMEQAIRLIKNAEWQYARRQKTWFTRNKYIEWFNSPEQAHEAIKSRLNT